MGIFYCNNSSMKNKILCIDFGTKNIGLAVSDNDQILSFAKKVIKADEKLTENLRQFIETEKIDSILVGSPHTGNSDFNLAQFCQLLENEFKLPVAVINEDYSTSDAFEKMEQLGLSKLEMQNMKDAYAAQVMLEKFLNS
jgi:putative Holliday junction resolvase